jgi:hypothetical protein
MPEQDGLGNHAPESAGFDQAGNCNDQMKQKDQTITHLGNRSKVRRTSDFTSNSEFAMDRCTMLITISVPFDSLRLGLRLREAQVDCVVGSLVEEVL